MNVLSLFDGMSCGRITLSELGIPVKKYYASEVDKFAIKATMQNFPDTIQLGDVRELEVSRLDKIDLIIGGSPCTNLSMSGKRKGLSTKEGMEVLDLQTYLELKENGFEFEGQSKQSPWISVNERLPEEGQPVLIRLKDGVIRLACYDIEEDSNIYFWNDNYSYETFRPWDVTHWREIPSFDEILETNKDVLQRLKEK